MDTAIVASHPCLRDLFDPLLEVGLIDAFANIVVAGSFRLEHAAGPADADLSGTADIMRRRLTRDEQLGEGRPHVIAPERARDRRRQALPARLVDDRQDPVFAAIVGSPLDEVVGPCMAGILGPKPDARPVVQPEPAALRLPLRQLQPFAAPNTLDPLAVHMPPRIAQQRRHPAIAITPYCLANAMISSVRAASSSAPRGALRCVDRCCPSTRQSRRSDAGILVLM